AARSRTAEEAAPRGPPRWWRSARPPCRRPRRGDAAWTPCSCPRDASPRRRRASCRCGSGSPSSRFESRTPRRRSAAGSDTFSHFMRIGVPKETAAGEHRVALVPEVVSKLKAKGLDVVVQSGAGADALLPDAAFAAAGATVSEDVGEILGSDAVVTIAPPDAQQIRGLGSGSILIGFLAPLSSPVTTRALAEAKATAFAMEAIARISRAQAMDALSSQSNVAGYRAALLGADQMGRFYP